MAKIKEKAMKAIRYGLLLLTILFIGSNFTGCTKVYTSDGRVVTEGVPGKAKKMIGRFRNTSQFYDIRIYPKPDICFELKPGQRTPQFELTGGETYWVFVKYYRDNRGMASSVAKEEVLRVDIDYSRGDRMDEVTGEILDFYKYWPGPGGVADGPLYR